MIHFGARKRVSFLTRRVDSMKAAVYKDIQKIVIEDRPIPQAGPGQAVVKIKYCGLCGTDMHVYWNGDPMIKPGNLVLGHENVGVISELGSGVANWKIGERWSSLPPAPAENVILASMDMATFVSAVFRIPTDWV